MSSSRGGVPFLTLWTRYEFWCHTLISMYTQGQSERFVPEVDIRCTEQVARIKIDNDYKIIMLKTRFKLTGTVNNRDQDNLVLPNEFRVRIHCLSILYTTWTRFTIFSQRIITAFVIVVLKWQTRIYCGYLRLSYDAGAILS